MVKTASLILTQYRSVTDIWTDGYAVTYAALAKLALWHAEKTLVQYQWIIK